MERIGTVVPGLLAQLASQPKLAPLLLARLWPRLVSEPLAQRTRPAAFSGGLLTVEVEDQGWLRELEPLSEKLRARVNETLGAETVKAVRLVLRRPRR